MKVLFSFFLVTLLINRKFFISLFAYLLPVQLEKGRILSKIFWVGQKESSKGRRWFGECVDRFM
jgi:hypothetical protein